MTARTLPRSSDAPHLGGAWRRAARVGGLALALASSTLGCSSSSEAEELPMLALDGTTRLSPPSGVAIDVRTDAPIRVGRNTMRVTFPERRAELVSVVAMMSAHGHGSPPPAIEREDSAFIVRDLVLFMPGRWELSFVVRLDEGGEDELLVALDLP